MIKVAAGIDGDLDEGGVVAQRRQIGVVGEN